MGMYEEINAIGGGIIFAYLRDRRISMNLCRFVCNYTVLRKLVPIYNRVLSNNNNINGQTKISLKHRLK